MKASWAWILPTSAVVLFRTNNKGKHKTNKVKIFKKNHPCDNPTKKQGWVCGSVSGKGSIFGNGSAVMGIVKKCFNDKHDGGTQNLVRHLAQKYKSPRSECRTRYFGERGWYTQQPSIFTYKALNAHIEQQGDLY